MIIDAHMHIGFHGTTPLLLAWSFTPEDLISRLDANKVEKAVCVPLWRGETAEAYAASNDYVAAAQARYPQRIIGFGWVNPAHGADICLPELERIVRLGLQGVGELHPYQGSYYVNGPHVYPIIERAAELGLPLLIHSDFGCRFSTPLRTILLAQDFPQAKIIMAHMGIDPIQIDQLPAMVKRCDNIWLETSATPDYPHCIENAVRVLGAERVIFGSDGPGLSLELALRKLELCAISDSERGLILSKNIERLLHKPS
jgi:predicted TIM-barrel fold metal-dependent hydrolase